jgi:hypothetical protein
MVHLTTLFQWRICVEICKLYTSLYSCAIYRRMVPFLGMAITNNLFFAGHVCFVSPLLIITISLILLRFAIGILRDSTRVSSATELVNKQILLSPIACVHIFGFRHHTVNWSA